MADSFAVHLGGGTYLDASGNLVFGQPSGAQIYEPPGGFRLDTKKIQDAFKDLSDILPANDDAKKKWMDWGVPKNIVDFLGSVAGVAGMIATAISTYMWAVGVLMKIMDALMADDGMSPQLANALTNIKNQLHGLEQIERADKMIEMHSEFDGRIDLIRGLLTRLVIEKPAGAARAQIFADMRAIIDQLAQPLSRLRNQEWATTYDPESYKGRGFASHLLVFERPDGSLAQVPMHSPALTIFDYRLGVPMLLYAATTFTALIEIAMPWFRSAGMYAGQLRKTAEAIDRFVLRMQDECLARTEHSDKTILAEQLWPTNDLMNPARTEKPGTYPVGAFDLVAYNDAFISDRWVAEFTAYEDTGPRGLFNYHWYTPLTDLGEIAAAANEQARQDYANLQVTTGMMRLLSTAAWLRFLSTPPDRSQTVTGSADDSRHFSDQKPTTAKSPWIFPVGVIEHPATLKRYDARNRIRITTQEPGYVPAFHYKIVLRTLESQFGQESWDNRSYVGDIWQASYEPTQGDPRCKRLKTELRHNAILSEVLLYEGPSPSQPVNRASDPDRPVKLSATTFDWYVPVVSPWSSFAEVAKESMAARVAATGGKKTMTGTGGVSIHLLGREPVVPAPMHFMGGPSPLVNTVVDEFVDISNFVSVTNVSLDKAERRHVRIEDVELEWQLSWTAEKLEVRLFGEPTQRPFQVQVVVEETVYSGETGPENIADVLSDQQLLEQIHTPFVAEIVNQLVFVPEEFFTKEREAIEKGSKMWHEFLRRFAEQAPIGPGDPIEFLDQSIRARAVRSQSTATLAATLDERVEFARREAPELWDAVVRELQRETASS